MRSCWALALVLPVDQPLRGRTAFRLALLVLYLTSVVVVGLLWRNILDSPLGHPQPAAERLRRRLLRRLAEAGEDTRVIRPAPRRPSGQRRVDPHARHLALTGVRFGHQAKRR